MKKTYIYPATEVVKVGTEEVIMDQIHVKTGYGKGRVYDTVD